MNFRLLQTPTGEGAGWRLRCQLTHAFPKTTNVHMLWGNRLRIKCKSTVESGKSLRLTLHYVPARRKPQIGSRKVQSEGRIHVARTQALLKIVYRACIHSLRLVWLALLLQNIADIVRCREVTNRTQSIRNSTNCSVWRAYSALPGAQ